MRTALALALSLISIDARADTFRVGGELGIYHNDLEIGSLTGLTEVIDADITLFDTVAIVGAFPFVQIIAKGGGESEARFRVGNPFVAAYYHSQGDILTLRVGGGVAFPIANIPDDEEGIFAAGAYGLGLAMYGLQNPWLWFPESFPLVVPSLRIGVDVGLVTLDFSADVVMLIPINDSDVRDVEVILPASAGAIVHISFIGIGARFGATLLATGGEGADKGQLSLSPIITAELGPVELEARLTMNLDDVFGFAFDDDGIYGFFLGVHVGF